MRYWRLLAFVVVILAALAVVNTVFHPEPQVNEPPPSPPARKVTVEAFLPIKAGGHRPTIEMLRQLAARCHDRVNLKLYDLQDRKQSGTRMKELRLNGPTVMVNGRHTFTLADKGGKPRQVNFQGTNYTPEDVRAVVMRELQKPTAAAPGMPPPGKR